MKQQLLIVLFLVLVIAALIGLNAVSYTKVEKLLDTEYKPNRSSYNSGATGTSALFSLLTETGNKVVRWQQPPAALSLPENSKIRTMVLVGATRREMSEDDAERLLAWVGRGNRLVLIDRYPEDFLLQGDRHWDVSVIQPPLELFTETDAKASLTDNVPAAKPVQPTALMIGINAIQPSRLASSVAITYVAEPPAGEAAKTYGYAPAPKAVPTLTPTPTPTPTPASTPTPAPTPKASAAPAAVNSYRIGTPSPTPARLDESPPPPKIAEKIASASDDEDSEEISEEYNATAPVVHLGTAEKDLLVDFPHGAGRIVFLSEPYIVSNEGIKFVDNATLAVNLVATKDATIAFDEYHQGYGSENTLLSYFSGTPVLAIFAQAFLFVAFVLWTRGRRFARPLPLPAKDRRSKLEYVAAMADLQQNTRAYDLVIENVYLNIKRSMVRLAGTDNTISKKQLADSMAERTGMSSLELYNLMAACEDIIAGEPTNAKETMRLVSQLRELEVKLGLNRNRKPGGK